MTQLHKTGYNNFDQKFLCYILNPMGVILPKILLPGVFINAVEFFNVPLLSTHSGANYSNQTTTSYTKMEPTNLTKLFNMLSVPSLREIYTASCLLNFLYAL